MRGFGRSNSAVILAPDLNALEAADVVAVHAGYAKRGRRSLQRTCWVSGATVRRLTLLVRPCTHTDIVVVTTIISSLSLVIAATEPLAARVRLPYTALLVVLGILIGTGAAFFLNTEFTDALNPLAEAILGLPISSNVFFNVFLPSLLFQATLGMNLRRMTAGVW